jgi:hypothetical protein
MGSAPFARYRHRLTALASGEAAHAALDAAGARTGFWPARLRWTPMFGRFDPDGCPFAVQVFESSDNGAQRIARVEAFDVVPERSADDEVCRRDPVAGFLRVTPLAADRGLPALGPLLASVRNAAVVRYHPGLRCTLRTVRGGEAVYAKVFHDDRGRQLCDDREGLWRASTTGELAFNVARPLAWEETTRTLWEVEVPGYSVRSRLATDEGPSLARRIGEALGSLAVSSVPPRRRFDAAEQMQRSVRRGAEVRRRIPSLAAEVDLFLHRLDGSHRRMLPRALRPIHGGAHPPHFLVTTSRLGLVDFDGFAAGDPELDVATVLSDLDFEDSLNDSARALEEQLVAGWEATAGLLDRYRLSTYRGHRHLAKALRIACAIRPDADRRAAASLRHSLATFVGATGV